MTDFRIALLGFGDVGREFCRILFSRRQDWEKTYGYRIKVVAITTKSRGTLFNSEGVDLERALQEIENNGRFSAENPELSLSSNAAIIADDHVDLVIEVTTLNIENGQPAADHISKALKSGKHVVTANKGPLAFHYRELKALAEKAKRYFFFEGIVMDGTPIFNLVRETLPDCKISGFSGILNSTTNYMLCEMADGVGFDQALKKAQKLGFVEADPSLDIDGWDAAVKTTALLNILMDADLRPNQIDRTGIRDITPEDIKRAAAGGKAIKLICEGFIKDGKPAGRVAPVAVARENPLASISGTSSAFTLNTDYMGNLTIEIEEPLVHQTAYALVSDLLNILKKVDQ